MSYAAEHPVCCAREGCPSSHPGSRWDTVKADRAGWFHQQDGTAWCPDDVPAWVGPWRERRAAGKQVVRTSFARLPATAACRAGDYCDSQVLDQDGEGCSGQLAALRARARAHAWKEGPGHVVDVTTSQVTTLEPAREGGADAA